MPRSFGTTNAAPYASAPPVGAAGDTYFNTTSKTLFLSDGTQWIMVQGGGGAGGTTVAVAADFRRAGAVPSASGNTHVRIPMDTLVSTAGGAVASVSSTAPTGAYDYWCDGNGVVHVGVAGMYLVVGIESASGTTPGGSAWITIGKSLATSISPSDPAGFQVAARTVLANIGFATSIVVWQGYLNVGDWVDTGIIIGTAYTLNQVTANNANTDPYVPALHISRLSAGLQGPAGATGPQGPDVALALSSYLFSGIGAGPVPSGSAGYWAVSAPVRATNFTVSASNSGLSTANSVFCQQAGRYFVRVEATISNTATMVTANYMTISLRQQRGATLVENRDIVCSILGSWGTAMATAIFDMQVGDHILINSQTDAAGRSVDGRSYIEVIPVGGSKGDPGAVGPPGGTFDGFRRRSSAASPISIPNATATAFTFDTVVDTQGGSTYAWDPTNLWITIPADGVYYIQATVQGNNQVWSATNVYLDLRVNGNTVALQYPSGSSFDSMECTTEMVLHAGDHVQVFIYGNLGTTVQVRSQTPSAGAPMSPTLSIWRSGTGVQGATGPQGAQGIQGAAGTGTGLNMRGEWNTVTAYAPNDVVSRNGVAFLAMQSSTNVDPGSLPAGSFAAISDLQAQIGNIGKTSNFYPVWRQAGAILPYTNVHAWYARVGEWVLVYVSTYFTGAGAAGNLSMDLPVPHRAESVNFNSLPGSVYIYNASGNNYGMWATGGQAGVSTVIYMALGANYYGTAVASGHMVSGVFMYPAPPGV